MSWTDEYHGPKYLDLHLPLLTDDVNNTDVDFMLDVLDIPKGSEILDLPCGFGRHSNILAERGYKVTGIDYKSHFIDLAIKNSQEKYLPNKVNFMLGDMRKLEFENQFDAVINFFTSFGYFDDNENFETLKGMARSLKVGGKLLIDMVNREWAINMTRENGLVWLLYPDNKVFLANNKFDILKGRWISEQIIVEKGESTDQHQDIRLYSYTEYSFLLNVVGLKIIAAYGDTDKSPYSIKSRNMILVAEKFK